MEKKEQEDNNIPKGMKWLYRLFGIKERTAEEEAVRQKELMQIAGKDTSGEKDEEKMDNANNSSRL